MGRQNDVWDKAMADMPEMNCGRLDMESYDSATGESERFVYFDGFVERVRVTGRFCDQVAYAANRYQDLVRENARITADNQRLREAMPDPSKLRTLAKWFTVCYTGKSTGEDVQSDLNCWADKIEQALAQTEGRIVSVDPGHPDGDKTGYLVDGERVKPAQGGKDGGENG